MSDRYAQQNRGSQEAYQRYLGGMDQTMRQKVALTAAHLLRAKAPWRTWVVAREAVRTRWRRSIRA